MNTKNSNQAKFSYDTNLDDETLCAEFLAKFEPVRGLTLAHKLGFHGKGSKRAANALMNYAQNKRAAISCRKDGRINAAMNYERICDDIYKHDISGQIECW